MLNVVKLEERLDDLESRLKALEDNQPVRFCEYVKQRTWAQASDIIRAWFKFHKVLRSGTLGKETDYYYTDESYRMAIFRMAKAGELRPLGWGWYSYRDIPVEIKDRIRLTPEERAEIASNTTDSHGALSRRYKVSWDTIRKLRPNSPFLPGRGRKRRE